TPGVSVVALPPGSVPPIASTRRQPPERNRVATALLVAPRSGASVAGLWGRSGVAYPVLRPDRDTIASLTRCGGDLMQPQGQTRWGCRLGLERLDDRIVPATQTFSGVGANAATALAAFEAAIGGANNGGGGGPQATGFRTINWDGVGLGATDGAFTNQVITPNHTVGIPVDRFEARGTIFEEIYAVSDTSFTTENPGLQPPVQFPPFSANKIFAMFNDNTIGLRFVLPGSTTPAAVRGFGAIFLDGEKANTSKIEFSSGSSDLGEFFVPAGASGQAEFLGVLFDTPVVTSAELTVGEGTLFSVHGGTVTSGPPDLSISGTVDQAATDDF